MAEPKGFSEYFARRLESVSRKGIKPDEMMKAFDEWATLYDQDMAQMEYASHENVAKAVTKYYPEPSRASVRILDVGAGTGLVAKELRTNGFRDIDGLDPNKGMLDVARQNGLYVNYINEFMTTDMNIQSDSYDCVTAASCYVKDHIPWETLREVVRIVKPGGLVFLGTRKIDDDYFWNLDKLATELEQLGMWKKIEKVQTPLHFKGHEGFVTVFRITK